MGLSSISSEELIDLVDRLSSGIGIEQLIEEVRLIEEQK